MSTTVIVNGAFGKMGQETVKAIQACDDFKLVGQLDSKDALEEAIVSTHPDVVIDFTTPHVVYQNALTLIEHHVHPVIGTTGLSETQIQDLKQRCEAQQLGGIIAPNFSVAAILTMQYAKHCIRYLPYAEIIELHHEKKLDAPSGTALKTAELMSEARKAVPPIPKGKESIPGARGADKHGIPIHSVRLPGLLAHEEIIFGGEGEVLTIRHDTLNRKAFMPGVLLACRKVTSLKHLVYGLESILQDE